MAVPLAPLLATSLEVQTNQSLLDRIVKKMQDTIDAQHLAAVDPDKVRRQRFTGTGSRQEIYDFLDSHLQMFGNRINIPLPAGHLRIKIRNNGDLANAVSIFLPTVAHIHGLTFTPAIMAIISQEVNTWVDVTQALIGDQDFSSSLLIIEIDDGAGNGDANFRANQLNLVSTTLINHYHEVLLDYRSKILAAAGMANAPAASSPALAAQTEDALVQQLHASMQIQ